MLSVLQRSQQRLVAFVPRRMLVLPVAFLQLPVAVLHLPVAVLQVPVALLQVPVASPLQPVSEPLVPSVVLPQHLVGPFVQPLSPRFENGRASPQPLS